MTDITLADTAATFVELVAGGTDPTEAARLLALPNEKQAARALMGQPTVRKALVAAVRARLEGEAAPLAVETVLEVLRDKKAPGAVRAKLALGVLDRALPKDQPAPADRPIAAMTVGELYSEAARLRARVDTPAPSMRDVTPHPTDPRGG